MPNRKIIIAGASLLALLMLYAVLGFFLVPRIVRSALQEFVTQKYGRPLAVDKIGFNPFTLTLDVQGLAFKDAQGGALLAFKRLKLNLGIASVWRRGASFEAIDLEGPYARVLILPDGSLNLAELAKPFEGAPAAQDTAPTRLFINHFGVSGGTLSFEDRTRSTPFEARVSPIKFELNDFSTVGVAGNSFALQGFANESERFTFSGNFALQPLSSRGKYEIANLSVATPWSYLQQRAGLELTSGLINLNGDYEFKATPTLDMKLRLARFAVTNLGIKPVGDAGDAGDAADAGDAVRLESIAVENAELDLARRAVTVQTFRVAGGDIQLRRDAEGQLNLMPKEAAAAEVAREPAAVPAVTSNAAPGPAWVVSVPDISVEKIAVKFLDEQVAPAAEMALNLLSLKVSGYSSAPDTSMKVALASAVNESAHLGIDGNVSLGSGALQLKVSLKEFDLRALQPYISVLTQIQLLGGELTTDIDLARTGEGVLSAKGAVEVAKLRTVDTVRRDDFINWQKLNLTGIDYSSKPARLRIGSIVARGPYARVIIAPDRAVNIAQLMQPAVGQKPSEQGAAVNAQPLAVSIGTVRMIDGGVNFADYWIQPNYAVTVQSLNGTIDGLSSDPRSRARMKLDGKVDRFAPARFSGEMNLLSAALYTDITVSLNGVELSSVTPYSGRFAGYKIEKGKLSVDVTYHVEDRKLEAKQRFVVDQLTLGERVESPDAVNLPLKLAVALLKDRNGVIDVGLPISGSLDDPKFKLGPIIWKAFIGLLGKVATSPFAFLGSLVGGGDDINVIEFAAGDIALDVDAQQRLTSVAKALAERPLLQLDVPMSYVRAVDGPALARSKFENDLRLAAAATNEKRGARAAVDAAEPAQRFALLVSMYRSAFGKDAVLPAPAPVVEALRGKAAEAPELGEANSVLESALVSKREISELELEDLGRRRAMAIQDVLLGAGALDPARVFLVATSSKSAGAAKAGERVRAELSLK